jgi:hypothetical protein
MESVRSVIAAAPDQEQREIIRKKIEESIALYSKHPEKIDDRLRELDREWDVERVLETQLAGMAGVGMTMGVLRRIWYLLPLLSAGFVLQRTMKGWCSPLTLIRKMGFRTIEEIDRERYALKLLRGDFRRAEKRIEEMGDASDLIDAIYH